MDTRVRIVAVLLGMLWIVASIRGLSAQPSLPQSYSSGMLLTIVDPAFGPYSSSSSGVIFVDGFNKVSRFSYAMGTPFTGGHTDIVRWHAPPATDYFWRYPEVPSPLSGSPSVFLQFPSQNAFECTKSIWIDGSNRTPFFTLGLLPASTYQGKQTIRTAVCDCYHTPIRNTTQCYQEGNDAPWHFESHWNGLNIWEFTDLINVTQYAPNFFQLPPCFSVTEPINK